MGRSRVDGRRPGRRWSLVMTLLLGLGPARVGATPQLTPTTHSTDRVRVAVVGPAQSELTSRLVAELRFLGLTPEVLPPPSTLEPAMLAELLRRADVVAAIRVELSEGRVEVWVVDRTTGELVVHDIEPSTGPDELRELAVHSAELLRAILAEVELEPPPAEPVVVVAASVAVPPQPRRPRFGLVAEIAAGGVPGDALVAAYARMQLRHMPHPNVGVVVIGTTLLGAAQVHAAERDGVERATRLRTGGLAAGPRFVLRRPDATILPDLSATIGPTFVDTGARTLAVDARVEAALGLEVVLPRHLRLRGEVAAGICTRTIRMRVTGRPISDWCGPHTLGALGLGVVF
jgi:hypothetical protein